MIQIFPDQGLETWFDRMTIPYAELGIFVNDVTPGRETVLSDLVEATWDGYSRVNVTPADWSKFGVLNHRFKAFADMAIPVAPAATPVYYGYFLCTPGGGLLLAVARYDGAPLTGTTGEDVPVTVLLGDYSGSF